MGEKAPPKALKACTRISNFCLLMFESTYPNTQKERLKKFKRPNPKQKRQTCAQNRLEARKRDNRLTKEMTWHTSIVLLLPKLSAAKLKIVNPISAPKKKTPLALSISPSF